ncbi:hypothetical protein SSS_04977 [Sarcoptes scabiei]|uniref:Uncharacterized protein n=1 Tax=Sarcoptes scabiei TaxID=52283 RepID=A0A834R9K9_SARSC|nr:hypothetical protein SSS_04977 [Sarcoptes scabiei]
MFEMKQQVSERAQNQRYQTTQNDGCNWATIRQEGYRFIRLISFAMLLYAHIVALILRLTLLLYFRIENCPFRPVIAEIFIALYWTTSISALIYAHKCNRPRWLWVYFIQNLMLAQLAYENFRPFIKLSQLKWMYDDYKSLFEYIDIIDRDLPHKSLKDCVSIVHTTYYADLILSLCDLIYLFLFHAIPFCFNYRKSKFSNPLI